MPEAFAAWPFEVLFVVLFAAAMVRGQAIYWLARWATTASLRNADPDGWRGRVASWLDSSAVNRGASMVRRIGVGAVPLAYLTVGLQSAVMAAAGVLKIRPGVFAIAQVPGALAWALIYSTIGWAMWEAVFLTAAGSPWGVGLGALLVLGALATVVLYRRRA